MHGCGHSPVGLHFFPQRIAFFLQIQKLPGQLQQLEVLLLDLLSESGNLLLHLVHPDLSCLVLLLRSCG